MFNIDLKWHKFNVDLEAFEAWVKENAEFYAGASADHDLSLHFTEVPPDAQIKAVFKRWYDLSEKSPEAKSYKRQAEKVQEKYDADCALIASATVKLKKIGLTADEIAAILGK